VSREGDDLAPDPVGIYLDGCSDAHTNKLALVGIVGEEFSRHRAAFLAGRAHFLREMRRRWGSNIVLVANWAKDRHRKPWDVLPYLNGICVEGNPVTIEQKAFLIAAWVRGQGRRYQASWNTESSPIFDSVVRPGSHWTQRHNEAQRG
jgi:hypothetical protein